MPKKKAEFQPEKLSKKKNFSATIVHHVSPSTFRSGDISNLNIQQLPLNLKTKANATIAGLNVTGLETREHIFQKTTMLFSKLNLLH